MGNTDKARQQAYRRRMQEHGYRQFAFWLDENTQIALKLIKSYDSSGSDLSTVVCEAIRHYHAYLLSKSVSSNVASNISTVASDIIPIASNAASRIASNREDVTSDTIPATTNVASNRYMSQDLENHILELRQSGMTLNEVAHRLFTEGYHNANGEPYSTGTISKAEARAKARRPNM